MGGGGISPPPPKEKQSASFLPWGPDAWGNGTAAPPFRGASEQQKNRKVEAQ